jgi:hypothetical protein
MHGYITTNNQYCGGITPSMVSVVAAVEQIPFISSQSNFIVYPNPTQGTFVLEQKGDREFGTVRIEVYGMRGEKVLASQLSGEKKHEFSLTQIPAGLYFVRVVADDYVETIKLILTR